MGTSNDQLRPWQVRAINLPEHADNIIHTDAGAHAAGFKRALVAGTTTYAYLTHPAAAAWGRDWVERGGCEVRFRHPVFDDDLVDLVPDGDEILAQVDGSTRASLRVQNVAQPLELRAGDAVAPMSFEMDEARVGYGARSGDTLSLYADEGIVHPVLWPNLGNQVTIATVVDGPWIHVRSKIQHRAAVPAGATVTVSGAIVDRFDSRAGERVILHLAASVDGTEAARIEHESIIRLA